MSVSRDKSATKEKILDAVANVLETRGFSEFGVNAVAREAGVSKVLVYRYFGGMEGLLQTFGSSSRFWPSSTELVGDRLNILKAMEPGARLASLLKAFAVELRRRPLTVEILAWEMVERNELTKMLEAVREDFGRSLFFLFSEELTPDIGQAIAMVVAAINYLTVRGRDIKVFAGLRLGDENQWKDFEQTIDTLCLALVGSSKGKPA